VSRQTGEAVEYTSECSAVGQLDWWCQCCHMQGGLLFRTTTRQMRCAAPLSATRPTSCENIISGSRKQFLGAPCREKPCSPPDPCTVTCPEPPKV
jgi:hypothetical protein